jgi:hypothetical protein
MSKGFAGTRLREVFLRAVRWMLRGIVGVASSAAVFWAAVTTDSASDYDDARLYLKEGDINAAVLRAPA